MMKKQQLLMGFGLHFVLNFVLEPIMMINLIVGKPMMVLLIGIVRKKKQIVFLLEYLEYRIGVLKVEFLQVLDVPVCLLVVVVFVVLIFLIGLL